jgi:cysteine synthase
MSHHRVHQSILSTVGATPLVRISRRMCPRPSVEVYAKLESFNPMGSVKDRLALGVIEWGERNGRLQEGQTVVECTVSYTVECAYCSSLT